jgi:hypothetical protein
MSQLKQQALVITKVSSPLPHFRAGTKLNIRRKAPAARLFRVTGVFLILSIAVFEQTFPDAGHILPFQRIVYVYRIDKLLQAGAISLDEGRMMLTTIRDHEARFDSPDWSFVLIRKMGVSSFLLVKGTDTFAFESGTKLVASTNLAACMEELKLRMS